MVVAQICMTYRRSGEMSASRKRTRRRSTWQGLAFAVAVCLAAPGSAAGSASEMPVASQCALPEGWSQVAEWGSRYVVFGELHGTHESPAFVGDLACALASRDRRVLVAVELDSTIDGALQDAWKQPVSRFKQVRWTPMKPAEPSVSFRKRKRPWEGAQSHSESS